MEKLGQWSKKLGLSWQLTKQRLDLLVTWKLSRNATDFKQNVFIELKDGVVSAKSEIAPNIRYNETPESIEREFVKFKTDFPLEKKLAADPQNFLSNHHKELVTWLKEKKFSNAFSFGIESLIVHFCLLSRQQSFDSYFKLNSPEKVYSSFSFPIMDINNLQERAKLEKLIEEKKDFKFFKIKVNQETAIDFVRFIATRTNVPLRIDANEGWNNTSSFFEFVEEIKNFPIEFIEQPFTSTKTNLYKEIKGQVPFPIIADESVISDVDMAKISEQFDGINIKLMKAGSYLNAIHLLQEAKKLNLLTMVGCMVETSLGINCAYQLCDMADFIDLDGFLLIKNDPYNFVTLQDGALISNSSFPVSF